MSIPTTTLPPHGKKDDDDDDDGHGEEETNPLMAMDTKKNDENSYSSSLRTLGALVVLLMLVTGVLFNVAGIFFRKDESTTSNQITIASDRHDNNNNTMTSTLSPEQEKQFAFDIARRRFQKRLLSAPYSNSGGFKNLQEYGYPFLPTHPSKSDKVINSIRIPKAGSSLLSVTARALAGCHPDGFPCCRFPGVPKGSCPRKGLLCKNVTGCVDHHPTLSGNEPIITTLRDPEARLLSGFFYAPPHRPPMELGHDWKTFVHNYTRLPQYRNVLTKMMAGDYAYHDFDIRQHTVSTAKANLCHKIAWFGLTDWPILSALQLYEVPVFAALIPNPVVFGLPPADGTNISTDDGDDGGLRINNDHKYEVFRTQTYPNNTGTNVFEQYNKQDVQLFEFAKHLFCLRVQESGILQEALESGIALEEVSACQELLLLEGNNNNKNATLSSLCP